jgi:hypothetical protein
MLDGVSNPAQVAPSPYHAKGGEIIVKPLFATLLVSSLLMPLASFAQKPDGPLTRAQVREQIAQLEEAGYTPGTFDPHYPEKIQAAQARLAVQVAGGSRSNESVGSCPPRQ